MNIVTTQISGIVVVETMTHVDHRGAFFRGYCRNELAGILGERDIAQINISRTTGKGAVRGMHYQNSPCAEMKLIRCLKGRVFDVAVDLRAGSSTFLKWHAEELAEGNSRMLVIPEGCAHGFQALEQDCELLYLHTAFYSPEAEGGVRFDDPALSIPWPLPVVDLSQRDRYHPYLTSTFEGIFL